MGRQAHSSFHPSTGDIVSSSAIPITQGQAKNNKGEHVEWETPRALTVEQIQTTIQDYVKAARLAKEAGFDGIEVHAANGYLIDQFLQSSTNIRDDAYGGSMENRVRFLLEILEALITDGAYPANRIGVRLSPNGVFGDMGSEDNHEMFPFVAEKLSHYGLAYLHVMDGLGFGYHGKTKVVTAMDMKMAFKGPLMCNVGLTKESAEGMLRSGAADLCCFGLSASKMDGHSIPNPPARTGVHPRVPRVTRIFRFTKKMKRRKGKSSPRMSRLTAGLT